MSKSLRLSASTGIHKGDRDYQQDQVRLLSHPQWPGCILAVVADGMGGLSGGRKASDQVMLTAKQLFDDYAPATDNAADLLQQIIQQAHLVIRLTAVSSEQEPHSTLAAFLINPAGDCHWAHSGDSRIYHFRGGELVHRSTDHSYVQTLVDAGQISEDEAHSHPESNLLMGCLGTDNPPPIGRHWIEKLTADDVLMACSDGVWHHFEAREIGTAVKRLTAREATEFLIHTGRSRSRGAGDNLALVIVKVEALT